MTSNCYTPLLDSGQGETSNTQTPGILSVKNIVYASEATMEFSDSGEVEPGVASLFTTTPSIPLTPDDLEAESLFELPGINEILPSSTCFLKSDPHPDNMLRPTDIDVPPPLIDLELLPGELKSQKMDANSILRSLNIPQTKRLHGASNAYAKADKPRALTEIANWLIETGLFCCCNNRLTVYQTPVWVECTQGDHFIAYLRREYPEQDNLWGSLKKSDFAELFSRLCTAPDIQLNTESLDSDNSNYICFRDAVYNLETQCFEDLHPRRFFRSFIDVSAADINEWGGTAYRDFLSSCSNDQEELQQRMDEIIGSCLFPGPFKGFHLLLGYSNTGKSLFANVLADIFGQGNYCGISDINALGDRWTMGTVVKTRLCICAELSNAKISKTAARTIKQAVGDDPIMVEEKYQDPISTRCDARFVVASNFMIDTDSLNDPAFENRLNITPFTNRVPKEQQNIGLKRELTTEECKGYIVWRALKAMHKWIDRNFIFTPVDIPLDLLEPSRTDDAALLDFIANCCTSSDPDNCVSVKQLYERYLEYVSNTSHPCISMINFSRRLSRLAPPNWESAVLPKSVYGKQLRGYRGVTIN